MGAYFDKERKHWFYLFTLRGETYKKRNFATKRDALEKEHEKREELTRILEIQATGMVSLRELANQYLDWCKISKQKNTYVYKKSAWKRFLEFLGTQMHISAAELTRKDIKAFLKHRATQDGNKAANRDLKDIRSTFTWAIEEEEMDLVNPCAHIRVLPEETYTPYVPPPKDVAKVRLMASGDSRDFLDLIIFLVARKNEIANLTWEDVNFRQGGLFKLGWARLWTRKAKSGERKAQYKPLGNESKTILERRFNKRDKSSPFVFRFTKKELRYMMHDLCEKAEVKEFGFHALRHYAASVVAQSGEDILTIQLLLGHERPTTTDKYLHRTGLKVRGGIDALEEALKEGEREISQQNNQSEGNMEG